MTTVLVLDVGGTNTRMALAERHCGRPLLRNITVAPTPRGSLQPLLKGYLDAHSARPAAVGAAVAGPVDGHGAQARARLTNCALDVSAAELVAAADGGRSVLLNDLAAAACALPALGDEDLAWIGASCARADATMLVIGVGTGIGVAARLADGAIVAGEGGHVEAPFRDAIAERLRDAGAASVEDMLAGSKLARLYAAVADGDGPELPEAVMARARAGDSVALATLAWHARALGLFARDCALTLGAWGGVFLMGGAIDGLGREFDADAFRSAFDRHHVFSHRLAAVPLRRITHRYPGLLGLAEHLLPR